MMDKIDIIIPVFRDAPRAIDLVASLASQRLSSGTVSSIVVVDDGSGDATASTLEKTLPEGIRTVRLPANVGRAQARNAGAAAATGNLVMFLDCDSHPLGCDFLELHRQACAVDHLGSSGPVVGPGNDFWSRYQYESMQRRERAYLRGETFVGSAANLMVRRRAFEEVGGFDPTFRGYGFEDRDLLVRLSRLGKIAWTREAVVVHTADLNLQDLSRKMIEAGGASAAHFSRRHPDEYRALGYSRVDARQHQVLRLLTPLVTALVARLVVGVDAILLEERIPFRLKAGLVRLATALSFLSGTART